MDDLGNFVTDTYVINGFIQNRAGFLASKRNFKPAGLSKLSTKKGEYLRGIELMTI